MKWNKKRALLLAALSLLAILLVPVLTDVSLLQDYKCSTGQPTNCDSINIASTNVEIGMGINYLSLLLLGFSVVSLIWFTLKKRK